MNKFINIFHFSKKIFTKYKNWFSHLKNRKILLFQNFPIKFGIFSIIIIITLGWKKGEEMNQRSTLFGRKFPWNKENFFTSFFPYFLSFSSYFSVRNETLLAINFDIIKFHKTIDLNWNGVQVSLSSSSSSSRILCFYVKIKINWEDFPSFQDTFQEFKIF